MPLPEFNVRGTTGMRLAVWGDVSHSLDSRVNSDPTHHEMFWYFNLAGVVASVQNVVGSPPTDAQLDAYGPLNGHRFAWAWASQPIPYAPVALVPTGGTSGEVSFTMPDLLHAGTWRLRCSLLDATGVLVRAKILPISMEYRP